MKIIFAGSSDFAIPFLEAVLKARHVICMVLCKPDKLAGRGLKPTPSPVKRLALKYNLPLLQPNNLNDESVVNTLRNLNADIFIDVAYGVLVPKTILQLPHYGCINAHPSLLPRWRGAAPVQHAILAGDEITGISIMQLDEGLDTGGIIMQQQILITQKDTTLSLLEKTATIGATLLLEVLQNFANNTVNVVQQDNKLATYASKITKEQGCINWTKSARNIDCMVRAFIPWPVAYMKIGDESIRIWECEAVADEVIAAPGTILAVKKDAVEVATGKGKLRILRMQLPGAKILPVKDILNAHTDMFVVGKMLIN
jgi:methionyl-tRNA formyltransferase